MDAQHKNLFPATLKMGMIAIFGEQSVQPVLLRLIDADTDTGLLHPKEHAVLSGYRLAKRRTEYLTGRICAKRAVHAFLQEPGISSVPPPALAEIEIARSTDGRPSAHLPDTHGNPVRLDLSISHSGDYGAALTAQSPCGIDLQIQKNTLLQVQEKYCTEAETRLLAEPLANCEPLSRLTLLWAAKEAAKKALSYWQMPGFLDLQLCGLKKYSDYCTVTLQTSNSKNSQLPEQITVVAEMFGDYGLAVCLVREEGGDAGAARG